MGQAFAPVRKHEPPSGQGNEHETLHVLLLLCSWLARHGYFEVSMEVARQFPPMFAADEEEQMPGGRLSEPPVKKFPCRSTTFALDGSSGIEPVK